MKRKYIGILLIASFLLTPLGAESIKDKKDELTNTQQHIKDKENILKEQKEEEKDLESQIKNLDMQVVGIEDNIKDLGIKLEQKMQEINQSEQNLEVATNKRDEQYESTKERMVQMYKNQDMGYMQVIFSSDNLWDAINKVEYIKRISDKDDKILDEYKEQIDIIEVHKDKIEKEKIDLDLLRAQEVAKKDELGQTINAKQLAINNLQAKQSKTSSEISELEDISAQLEADIKRITKEMQAQQEKENKVPVEYGGGTFTWPVPGWYRISSEYGPRTSPIFGKTEFHTGIDIPASYGQSVSAAASGTVITAGWVRGYGNTVIISHGSGLVTLYGHNSSLTVTSGQKVSKGETIAKIGSTGYSTGNHLHFEVRLNDNHTNPWNYLK